MSQPRRMVPEEGSWGTLSHLLSEKGKHTCALGRRVLSQHNAEKKFHVGTTMRPRAEQGEVPSNH